VVSSWNFMVCLCLETEAIMIQSHWSAVNECCYHEIIAHYFKIMYVKLKLLLFLSEIFIWETNVGFRMCQDSDIDADW
jgi:hypothetical protein